MLYQIFFERNESSSEAYESGGKKWYLLLRFNLNVPINNSLSITLINVPCRIAFPYELMFCGKLIQNADSFKRAP